MNRFCSFKEKAMTVVFSIIKWLSIILIYFFSIQVLAIEWRTWSNCVPRDQSCDFCTNGAEAEAERLQTSSRVISEIYENNGSTILLTCQYALPEFILVIPEQMPPPKVCVGNPIEVSAGSKYQREEDVFAKDNGLVNFDRYYIHGSGALQSFWRHNYDRKLVVLDTKKTEWIKQKSKGYPSKHAACELGWKDIKSEISADWAVGSIAHYDGQFCRLISSQGEVIRTLSAISAFPLKTEWIPSSVLLMRPYGNILEYQFYDTSSYSATNGDRGVLERVNATNVMWRYTNKNGDIEEYSKEGKLLSLISANGMKQLLTYDSSGLLSNVKDATGGELTFSYTSSKLTSVTGNNNQITNYIYNASGLLTQVTRPDNTTRTYHYENTNFPTALTGITDERGIRYATWIYDDQGHAIASEHADGTDKTLLAFNADGTTTVTNPLGKQTTYHFADIAGARRVTQVEGHATTSCEGANQDYTYTPEGWLASKTDWKGNTTTYAYNTFGQEISRTEASGTPQARTITTEWHPNFYVKTRVVDGGKETLYTYDDNGRLLSTTTNPLSIQ